MNDLRRNLVCPVVLALTLVVQAACTSTDLRKMVGEGSLPHNKLQIVGSFCSTSPSRLHFPMKLIFVLDHSSGMAASDPDQADAGLSMNRRQIAVREIWKRYETNPDYWVSVIAYPRNSQSNLPWELTRDLVQGSVDAELSNLVNPDPNGLRPMKEALEQVKIQIIKDYLQYDSITERPRLHYAIVLLAGGYPRRFTYNRHNQISGAEYEPEKEILALVSEIQALEERDVGNVTFNTVLLQNERPSSTDRLADTQSLLEQIAILGHGEFLEFTVDATGHPLGPPLSFRSLDFSSFIKQFELKTLQASNRNVWARSDGTLDLDSDGDGLSDSKEEETGSDPYQSDTDGDFCSDFLEWTTHTNPLMPGDCNCPEIEQGDQDGDGLRDCEEKLLGTSPLLFDSDQDGLTDQTEFLAGTNFLQNDTLEDHDLDGVINREEVRQHTLPLTSDPGTRPTLAYEYKIEDAGVTEDSRPCYKFTISNISLGETGTPANGLSGLNQICLTIVESSPAMALRDPGVMRTGCLEIVYLGEGQRVPPGDTFEMLPDDPNSFAFFQ